MSSAHERWQEARTVCVIGAGTMGSGIAAHLANLEFEVSLLDLTAESVREGFDRARASRPPHFYVPENTERIRLGSIEKELAWVRDADWVCEAIVERLDAKRELFERIDPMLRPDAMISTNTSGLQISLLADGRSEDFKQRFLGTHFFNPPRYLKLLELIPTSQSDPDAVKAMARFLEERVARRVVIAKDTPGFIANRFGMWSMIHTIHVAEKLRLTPEQVDAITGPFLGRPRSASFRLNDLVGLDIMEDIAGNLRERCAVDPMRASLELPRTMKFLLDKGWIGEKVGQGYFRREGKDVWTFDLATLAYRMRQDVSFASTKDLEKLPLGERVSKALDLKDEVGEFLRSYLVPTLQYAERLKEEISQSVLDFDRVMKWGFGWEMGPFEMIDAIGKERLGISEGPFYKAGTMLAFSGKYAKLPSEPEHVTLSEFPVVAQAETFNLRDMGDGVTAICLSTKMGIITPQLVFELGELLDSGKVGRFVLTSEGRSFSAGFDLKFFSERIDAEDWEAIEVSLANLQQLSAAFGRTPGVAMLFGHALGAGFELALGCSRIVTAAETKVGFPEARVGLLPGGSGTARTRTIAQTGGAHALAQTALCLTQGYVADSADEARKLGYFRSDDKTVYLVDRLVFEAKKAALGAGPAEQPSWRSIEGPLVGMIDRGQLELQSKSELTDHDLVLGDKIKAIFAKSTSFSDALSRERQGFVDLCKSGLTLARIRHMMEFGKPLRN